MSTFGSLIQRDTRAAQPAATAVPVGTLYFVTDEGVTERSSGTAWEAYSSAAAAMTQLTGDVTAGPGSGSQAATLASTAVTPGSYGDATHVAAVTVDAKGRVTAASAVAITASGTVTTSGSPATGNLTKFTGAAAISNADLTGDVTTSGGVATTLANTAVTPGSYGDGTHVAAITVDSKGRLTAASAVAITGGGGGGGGVVQQIVTTESGAVATSSTVIPFDDTIPQNTEGVEVLTRTITPASATNKLRITVTIFATVATTPWIIAALFQDAGANALAAAATIPPVSTGGGTITFGHTMDAGTTSATTFKVRVGPSAAVTLTVNGQSSGRIFGGVSVSSLTVMEYTP